MKIAIAIIAIFCARFAVSAWFYPGQDADLGWQQTLGTIVLQSHQIPAHIGQETFTAPGARWIPHEWAFSTVVAAALAHGSFGILALLVAAIAAGALLLTAWRSRRRGSSTFATALTTACVGFAMMQSFGVRAQIVGWLLLAIILLLLDMEGPWIFLAIPIVALWANLHASALVAPVLIGAWALGTAIEDRAWTPRVRRNALLAAGSVLAVFLTPFFWHLPAYAIALQTSAFRSVISEWQPSDIFYPAVSIGLLPLLTISCYFGIAAPRERWRDGMLFAVSTLAAFTAVRHLPICALVIAPMAAQRLSVLLPERARMNVLLNEKFGQALVYASAAIAGIVVALTLIRTPAIAGNKLPGSAVARLALLPGVHRLYCEDFAWCSLALGRRNLRVFLDGRCDPYPQRIWDDYVAVQRTTPRWSRVLDDYRVDSVLALRGRPLATLLQLRRDWRVIYAGSRYVVFVRNDEPTRRNQ